jgi:hypothetical protein
MTPSKTQQSLTINNHNLIIMPRMISTLNSILSQSISHRILRPRDQPEPNRTTPVRVQVHLRQQLLPNIPVGDRLPRGVQLIALRPYVNVLCNPLDQVRAA